MQQRSVPLAYVISVGNKADLGFDASKIKQVEVGRMCLREMALLRKGVMGGKKRQFMGFGEVAEDPSAAIPVGDKKIGF